MRAVTPELREALPHLRALDPPAQEVLIFTDKPTAEGIAGVKIIGTGPLPPPLKRNQALIHATGEVFAFLDDDAYPETRWLAAALPYFEMLDVAAVGGPALTPPHDGWRAQISGAVLTARLGSGPAQKRYWTTGSAHDVDDWPSVNLLVRRSAFAAVGGFTTTAWPGDDTKLCLDLLRRHWRIVYEPRARVYHHRASTFGRHFRQVARYGLHRGHFARIYPQTSRRLTYLLPSLLLMAVVVGLMAAVLWPPSRTPLLIAGVMMVLAALSAGLREAFRMDKPYLLLFVPPILLATHLVYGAAFLRGFLSPHLKRYQRTQR